LRYRQPPPFGNEIILVVEDKTEVRVMSADVLGELGYTVLQAEDANQALSVLASQPKVDDVVMPGIDGRQLAIKAKDLFLPKPYTMSELSRKVREVLDGGGSSSDLNTAPYRGRRRPPASGYLVPVRL
jgi:hypothetical protein